MINVLAIILNYKTPSLVIDCLRTLCPELDATSDRVVVVDNCSNDDSVTRIGSVIESEGWSNWVKFHASDRNGGFSYGNNIGLLGSSVAKYYLLLNSDTLVRPGAVRALLDGARSRPDCGLIGPRLEWPDSTAQVSGFRFHTPWAALEQAAGTGPISRLLRRYIVAIDPVETPTTPQWVSFAAVLIKRQVIEVVGGMDESFFMYFEDDDYCRMAATKGFSCLLWPEARIVHLRGGSSPVKRLARERKRLPPYFYSARTHYYRKWYGWSGWILANILWTTGACVALIRAAVGNKPLHLPAYQWLDIWRAD